MRKNSLHVAENVIAEARTIAMFLVDIERGKCGGDVDIAMHRVSALWGVEEGSLRSLRYRWRELHDIKASILERLREAYETVYERQRVAAANDLEIQDIISRGGAGGAQEGGAAVSVAPSILPCTTPRSTVSRADEPAKRQARMVADLQLEKEH